MDLDYKSINLMFEKYVEDCRSQIKKTFFDEQVDNASMIHQELLNQNKIQVNSSIQDAIKFHKNQMINIKLNHTMRIVSDVEKMSMKMNTPLDFTKLVKIAALLHDIARFNQAVWSNSFNDKSCSNFNGMNHAEYGYNLLYVNGKISDFNISPKYRYIICNTVRYHQLPILTGDLSLKIHYIHDLDVEKYLTGSENLNDREKIIVSTLVQMVKDVDMLDILYQHLTGEFPVVRPYITFDVLNDSLDDISKYWGISSTEIMKYNGLNNSSISNISTLQIPIKNILPSKLEVPKDIQTKFFNNENLDLRELQNRRDWTFITGMWWRLNHFLNNINFTSNLEMLEENKLLDAIYNTYPSEYKPLVEPAFLYAKEYLLEKKIKDNKDRIYIK